MYVRTRARAWVGTQATDVEVGIRLDSGVQFHVAGMPGSAARDLFLRVRAALDSSGCGWPKGALTVHISPLEAVTRPADFDLPVALLVAVAAKHLTAQEVENVCSLGELSLDGRVLRCSDSGATATATEPTAERVILPIEQAREMAPLGHRESKILGARNLSDIFSHLKRGGRLTRVIGNRSERPFKSEQPGLEDIEGCVEVRKALVAAAAGRHHILMMGPPGTGKTFFGQVLSRLVPSLDEDERREVSRLHLSTGLPPPQGNTAPLRSPHSSASAASLLGSMPTKIAGAREVIAGEISLAHHGVLCLDELPEFNRVAIEGLRQPMESGVVHLARAGYTANLPAKCIISATANPCPCGHYANQHRTCICTPGSVRHYRKRLSGPILERFGIHLDTGGAPPDVDGSSKAALWTDTEHARKMIQLVRLRWQQFPETPTTERSPEMWHVIKEFSAVTHWSYRSQLAVARLAQTLAWMRDPDLPWGLLAVDAAAEACEFRIFDRSGWFDAHRHPSIPQTHA